MHNFMMELISRLSNVFEILDKKKPTMNFYVQRTISLRGTWGDLMIT